MTGTVSGQLFSVSCRWTHANTQADNSILRLRVTVGGISVPVCWKTGINHCHRMEEAATVKKPKEQNKVLHVHQDKDKT